MLYKPHNQILFYAERVQGLLTDHYISSEITAYYSAEENTAEGLIYWIQVMQRGERSLKEKAYTLDITLDGQDMRCVLFPAGQFRGITCQLISAQNFDGDFYQWSVPAVPNHQRLPFLPQPRGYAGTIFSNSISLKGSPSLTNITGERQSTTMDILLMLVDELAFLKINQLQLYMEHTFAYRQHQKVFIFRMLYALGRCC